MEKVIDYSIHLASLKEIIETDNIIGSLNNVSAYIFEHIPRLNWVGFYFLDKDQLRLGPFVGKIACTKIALNKGVCGFVAKSKLMLVVDDVHKFPDHIACDAASLSEAVYPLIKNNKLIGVFDIDSPVKARFDLDLSNFLEQVSFLCRDSLDLDYISKKIF